MTFMSETPVEDVLLKCHICGKPATCVGVYEGRDDQPRLPACDDCCGHGNEDGWCVPLEPQQNGR